MANMVNVFLYGKKYEVPGDLTIMEAFEYAGYKLVRGVRLPKRILRRVCDRLPHQGRSRAEGVPCVLRRRSRTICMSRRCRSSRW